ncbi:MAG: intradiol ring-cleavage dioxygenase [Woeseiaceae bacterium]
MNKILIPTPEMVEGPYYSIGGKYRSDIRDGQEGQKLKLTITVVDAGDGAALAGVDVDLWQCNATGHYSGYDDDPDEVPDNINNGIPATNDDTYLRGRQTTDQHGQLTFHTVYPGWYTLRTPHIHLKIFEGNHCNTTTQLYLPERINQEVYRTAEYARVAEQDTFNNTDLVIGNTADDIGALWVDVDTDGDVFHGAVALPIIPGNVNDLIIVPPGRIPPKGGRPHDKPVR